MRALKYILTFLLLTFSSVTVAFCRGDNRLSVVVDNAKFAAIGQFKKEEDSDYIHVEKKWKTSQKKIRLKVFSSEELRGASDLVGGLTIKDKDRILIISDQRLGEKIILPSCGSFISVIPVGDKKIENDYVEMLDKAFKKKKK